MPAKYLVKPALKLTSKQWKRLVERVMMKQTARGMEARLPMATKLSRPGVSPLSPPGATGMAPELTTQSISGGQSVRLPTSRMLSGRTAMTASEGMPAEAAAVMGREPPTQRVFGRVYGPEVGAGKDAFKQPMDYPWFEAMGKYMAPGSELTAETGHIPPADILSFGPKTKAAPKGVSYERRIFRPVKEPGERAKRLTTEAKKEEVGEALEVKRKMRKVGGPLKKVEKLKVSETPTEERLNQAVLLDQLWKSIGGKRTLLGRAWEMYRQGGRGRYKVDDARDYFIRVGLRYFENPEQAAKIYPREVRALKTILGEFAQDVPELGRFIK